MCAKKALGRLDSTKPCGEALATAELLCSGNCSYRVRTQHVFAGNIIGDYKRGGRISSSHRRVGCKSSEARFVCALEVPVAVSALQLSGDRLGSGMVALAYSRVFFIVGWNTSSGSEFYSGG